MNKLCYSALVLSLGAQLLVTAGVDGDPSPNAATYVSIPLISSEQVAHFKDALISSEKKRSLLYYGALTGVTLLGAYTLGKMGYDSFVREIPPVPDAQEVAARVATLERRVGEHFDEPNADDRPWYKTLFALENLKNLATMGVVGTGKFAASFIGKVWLSNQIGKFIIPAMPSVGDYFLSSRSMKWCLVQYADFYNVVVNYRNWYERCEKSGFVQQDSAELGLCASHLVLEAERILGYIEFVESRLTEKTPGYAFYTQRAAHCKQALSKEVNTIATEAAKLQDITLDGEQLEAYVDLLRRRLFSLVVTLEAFEVVPSAVGLASAFEEDIFGPLKRYIYLEWAQDKPQFTDPSKDNPLEELMAEMGAAF